MSKRPRSSDDVVGEDVNHAIELICARPVKGGEATGVTLTPLEKQVFALKEAMPPHVLLMVACGYRVKVYGRDSHVVSRRCGIMCIPGQPFEYSSFPYTRVDLYVHRLIAMGYHVGFADQESAAVRAADGVKSGIFTRTVDQLYSRGTLLPSERVRSADSDMHTSSSAATKAADGEAEEAEGGEELDGDAVGAGGSPAAALDASELFLCFMEAPTHVRVDDMTPAAPDAIRVILVSFVTRRRDCYTVGTALALEDVLQRYDVVEVIVLAPTSSSTSAKRAVSGVAYLNLLPEPFVRALHSTLPLNFGPTVNGEEDGKSVSVCGYTVAANASLDDAIATYLKPYRLDRVYEQLRQGSTRGAGATNEEAGKASDAARIHDSSAAPNDDASAVLALPGSTLRALDVFHSSVGAAGSLVALLDHSLTPCGARRLREWLAAPPARRDTILSRQACVTAMVCGSDGGAVEELLREAAKVGDVEATLGKLHAQRCGVLEYVRLLRMVRGAHLLAQEALTSASSSSLPPLMRELLSSATNQSVEAFLTRHAAELDTAAATPLDLFSESTGVAVPEEMRTQLRIRDAALRALDAELERARVTLKLPGLQYRTIVGTAFVLDVPSGKNSLVPSDWTVLSRTKTNVRYHTPVIVEQNVALCAARERLSTAAVRAWQAMQSEVAQCEEDQRVMNGVIRMIASLDALRCLAVASSRAGYVAPDLVESAKEDEEANATATSLPGGVLIKAGRHPVLDRLMRGGYVSCDVELRHGCTWLLTGPNMGGKSALMRMIGTFVLLAQLGCYVPAASARLSVFDGVYCRMGASDSILEGSSTFLMEMEETSRILRAPRLSRALVLMDELGRGTSSFDGVAVAAATLEYLVQRHVTTVFVTHYTYLCDPYRNSDVSEAKVDCYFMGYREENVREAERKKSEAAAEPEPKHTAPSVSTTSASSSHTRLVFTYKPCRGVTPSSFGVEVAKLAGLPTAVTDTAKEISLREEQVHSTRMALMQIASFAK